VSQQPQHDHADNIRPLRPRDGDTSGLDTSMPHDLDAEQAALGAMLLQSPGLDPIADVTALVDAADYYRPVHATIHTAIAGMHERGEPVDPITVTNHLRTSGDLDRVGGPGYLHSLVQKVPTAANGAHYAEIVAEKAVERRIIETTTRTASRVRTAGEAGVDIAADAERELAALRTAERWPPPVPLGTHAALPVFPINTLPPWVGEHVAAVAEFTQTPPDMAATMALAALSTAAGGRVHIQIRPGWVEQSNLYLVCAMPPASRKSDVFALMTAPIYEMEKQLQDASRAARVEAQTAKDAAEAEAEGLMAKARKPDQASEHLVAEASAARMLAEDIVVPPKPRLTAAGDITPEPLTHQLALHRCLAVLSPEGDLFDIIAGRYSARPNLGVFLKGHKGERLETDRITREQPSIDKPALTIGITPQPSVLQDLGDAHGARDRGLLARFLYALPASNLGYRKTRTTPVPDTVAHTYGSRLDALLRTLTDLPEPVTLTMDALADQAVEELQAQLEVQLRPGQPLEHLQDWAGKLVGTTARVACLLHLADHLTSGWGQPLTAATVHRAADITGYYTEHALAVFDLIGSDPATEDARTILNWLSRPKTDGTHRRTIKRRDAVAASRRFRTVSQVDPALQLLESHGYLKGEEASRDGKRGRPETTTYRVHPSLHTPAEDANAR
jgi:replicative DNA helicase